MLQPQYEGQDLQDFNRQLDAEARALTTSVIKDITIEIISSLNILPDGTPDLTKSNWRYGGIVYRVTTTSNYAFDIETTSDIWHCPDYAQSSKSLNTLILKCIDVEQALVEFYKGETNES